MKEKKQKRQYESPELTTVRIRQERGFANSVFRYLAIKEMYENSSNSVESRNFSGDYWGNDGSPDKWN